MPTYPTETLDAVVFGAGLSGLTVAHALASLGAKVRVVEATARVGGAIRSSRTEGYLVEHGPSTLLVKSPEVQRLVQAVAGADWVPADPTCAKRFLVRRGRVLPLPSDPWSGLTTPLYSLGAKCRILAEPFIPQAPRHAEESVAQFVRRRLGAEFLDYGIAALVSGVYAGNPEALLVRHAFPKVWRLEAEHGSLIRGALSLRRRQRKSGKPTFKSQLGSFNEGLEVLPQRLHRALGNAVLTESLPTLIQQIEGGWYLESCQEDIRRSFRTPRIFCAVPEHALDRLPWPTLIGQALATRPRRPHPPVCTVTLGYRRDQVAHALDGFGVLCPPRENRGILGVLFTSSLFARRAPDDHVTLMVFLGGSLRPELAALAAAEQDRLIARELGELLGVRGEPTHRSRRLWPEAIPQYTSGHTELLALLGRLEKQHPGLCFLGNYRGGPGLSDVMQSALDAATRAIGR